MCVCLYVFCTSHISMDMNEDNLIDVNMIVNPIVISSPPSASVYTNPGQ